MTSFDARPDTGKRPWSGEVEMMSSLQTSASHADTFDSQASGDKQRTLWKNAKKYRKVVWITLAISSAILLYGYDYVIVGTISALPEFQKDFGIFLNDKWIIPSQWLAIWNVASPLGGMFGSISGAWFQDRFGRRLLLAVSAFGSAVGVAIMFVSYVPADILARRLLFFMGKLVQGVACGAIITAAHTYMSEILPISMKGSGMAFFPVFTLLGQLTGALVIFACQKQYRGYVIAFGSQWPFSFLPMVVAYFIPESPTWLVRTRQVERALKEQARLDPPGTNTKAVIDGITATIAHEESLVKAATFMQCFHKRNFRRTFIVLFAMAIPNFFGIPLMAKASYFLQVCGMSPSLSIVLLILGIILGLLSNVASVWVVSRFAHRALAVSTLGICTVLWLSMGVANLFKGENVVWWTAASMMLVITVAGVGVWPVSFGVAGETSTLQLRAKTAGLSWMVSALSISVSGIALPYVFNPDAGDLRGKIGFTYFGAGMVGTAVWWYFVPEMKGRSVGEIDRMFELGLGAREFKGWQEEKREEKRSNV